MGRKNKFLRAKENVQHAWSHSQELRGNLQLPALYTCPRCHSPEFYKIQERVIKRKQKNGKKEKRKENNNINPETFSIDSLYTMVNFLMTFSCLLIMCFDLIHLLFPTADTSYVLPPLLSLPLLCVQVLSF